MTVATISPLMFLLFKAFWTATPGSYGPFLDQWRCHCFVFAAYAAEELIYVMDDPKCLAH